MPIGIRIAKPASVAGGFETRKLTHVHAPTVAQCDELAQFVLAWWSGECDDKAVRAVTAVGCDAWDSGQPFEEGAFIVRVTEGDTAVHMGEAEIGTWHCWVTPRRLGGKQWSRAAPQ